MHMTSEPSSTWLYMLDTWACSCAVRSGAFDWVVVRTPPGISSTVRVISVCRLNMSM